MTLYLNANAHVPLSENTLNTYLEFNKTLAAHGHPLSPSVAGRAAMSAIETARAQIATLIGSKAASQIIFTNSCTQACEWAIQYLKQYSLYISPLEHPAVSRAAKKHLSDYTILDSVTGDGVLEVEYIDNSKQAIACIHVQNEIGTIQPIEKLGGFITFSDMSQSLGKIPVNVTDLDVDIATFGSHKFGGPGGVGFMYLKDINMWSEFATGSRYFMDIPGTPNTSGIVATAAALSEAIETLDKRTEKMIEFRTVLEIGLTLRNFKVIGRNSKRCPNVTFVKTPKNAIDLMLNLGLKGIHCGLGSACGSLYTGGSPLMKALGDPSNGEDYLRFSQWGEYGREEANLVLNELDKLL